MHLIAAQFDANRTIDDYMDVPTWRACHAQLTKACAVLEAHPQATLGTIDDDELADLALAAMLSKKKKQQEETPEEEEEKEVVVDTEAPFPEDGCVKVVGNLLTYVTRLEDEYVKSLQHINPHTQEYVARLRDERPLEELAGSIQSYYDRSGDGATAATIALMRIEHMYYKHDSIAAAVREAQAFRAAWGGRDDVHAASRRASDVQRDQQKTHPGAWLGAPSTPATESSDTALSLKELCGYVYDHGDDRCRTRAVLCHVAHHALHGRFHAARDLLLMSHLQEVAHDADVETQILYNRAMVLLGLCAFRSGLLHDAHSCLAEICSSRVKELLAQGVQSARWSDKSDEQEKAERRRQTPYHMHVNLDLLECCHLTSAMLLEVPAMVVEEARNKVLRGAQQRTRVTSRHFRKHMDIFSRQVFTGPPENTRDHILCAAKALALGDWRECARLVVELDVWDLIPGGEAAGVKEMVREKIKAEALRTYLFARADAYDALSLERLCATFEMPERTAHGLVSKMMITRELKGAWDQPTKTIVLQRLEPSPIQALALAYADRCAALVDANERLLDARAGGKGYKDDRRDWDNEPGKRGKGGGWGGRGGGRGRGNWEDRGKGRGRGRGKGRGKGRGSNSSYVQRTHGSKKYGVQDRKTASARRW
jgi:translation initiation factor 3 subunit C